MQLYDEIGINCKKDATTENQGADVVSSIWAKWCTFDDRVCPSLSLVEGESHGI